METKYIFYAETIEVNGFKVLFEILEKNFPNEIVHFKVNKNGIFIFMEKNNLIIDSSFYGKYMNKFEYNPLQSEEEFLFGIPILDLIEIRKEMEKKDILRLLVNSEERCLNIKIFKEEWGEFNPTFLLPFLGIQNYINVIPQGYCDFPINLNNSKLWKKNKSKNKIVKIQLMKNTIKFSFHDIPSIIIGDITNEILYEDIFKTELISNIIKISSFGTLRIYYGKDFPLLFSAMVGCGSGNINLYVSPIKKITYDTVF